MLPVVLLALALASPQTEVSPGAVQEARELAHRSQLEYDLGNAEDALRDIKRAYLLDPRPGLLFNLGQCQRKLKHWEDAETAYRNYLRYRPDAPNRDTVIELIEEMRKEQARAQTAAAQTPRPQVTPPPRPAPPPAAVAPAAPLVPASTQPVPAKPPNAAPAAAPSQAAPASEAPAGAWADDAPKPGKSHALAWTFLAIGIAAAAVAVVGAVDVAQYQSTSSNVAAAAATTGNVGASFPSYTNLVGQESTAMTFRAVGFVALGVACASIPAVILAW